MGWAHPLGSPPMAKSAPWSERSGAQRRRTFGGFGLLYGAIGLAALVAGWLPVGLLFGLGAVALGIAWMTTDGTDEGTATVTRSKPDWMLAMDDPDAPDLSRPEYNTERQANSTTAADGPTEASPDGIIGGATARGDGRSPFERGNPSPDAAPEPGTSEA